MVQQGNGRKINIEDVQKAIRLKFGLGESNMIGE